MADFSSDTDLHQWLRDRVPTAVTLRILDAHALRDWELIPTACHQNAERWVNRFAGFQRVRGWVIEGGREFGAFAHAHSVVQDQQRVLWDVTLDTPKDFVVYVGPSELFDANTANCNWVQLCLLP